MMTREKRAQGAWLGQLCGDAIGSIVEFCDADEIREQFPAGVRELLASPVWNTLPGQPTDDSEMAMALAYSLLARGGYDAEAVFDSYVKWLASGPFDVGSTIRSALSGVPQPQSQANGAMMRASPIGIFGARLQLADVAAMARQDAALTHVNPIVGQANALFAMAISHSVATGPKAAELYACLRHWADEPDVNAALRTVIAEAAERPPATYTECQGWVMIAWQNALWQLLHAASIEEALVDTVHRGGDTDTNAAICGALLGAVYGVDALPLRWREVVLACRPEAGRQGVARPRPACYWPVDAMDLATELVGGTHLT